MENKPEYQIEKTVIGREVTPVVVDMLFSRIAPVMGRAHGMSVDKTSAILLKGYELGLSITASLELVQTVQGKTSLSPRGALALVQNSPVIKAVKLTRLVDAKGVFTGYECYIERVSGFSFTSRWTLDQAAKAGLIKAGGGWESYPENMCMYRAIGFAADVAASDVTCGLTAFLKMPEQFNLGIDDGGNVVDAQSVTISTPAPLPAEIERLCNAYGAEAVMSANNGVIPASMDDCERIEAICLGGE